jgi:hypothetical protein
MSDATLTRLEQALTAKGITPGSAGFVNQTNPLSNFFGRVDLRLNDTHRAVFRVNYSDAESPRSQQNRNASTVVYTSQFHDFSSE